MKKVVLANQMIGQHGSSRTSLGNLELQTSINQSSSSGLDISENKKEEIKFIYVGENEETLRKKKEEEEDPISEKLRDLREKKDKERNVD